MIYIASVYSLDADEALMEARYQFALKLTSKFTIEGECVFSPIVHSHPMSLVYDFPREFHFWEKLDYAYLDRCTGLRVLCMPGWERSRGVTSEIAYAKKIGLPIEYYKVSGAPPASAQAVA